MLGEQEFLDLLLEDVRARSILSLLSTAYGIPSGMFHKASRAHIATGRRHYIYDRCQAEFLVRSLVYDSDVGVVPFLRLVRETELEDWPLYLSGLDNRSGASHSLAQELLAVSGALLLGCVPSCPA